MKRDRSELVALTIRDASTKAEGYQRDGVDVVDPRSEVGCLSDRERQRASKCGRRARKCDHAEFAQCCAVVDADAGLVLTIICNFSPARKLFAEQ